MRSHTKTQFILSVLLVALMAVVLTATGCNYNETTTAGTSTANVETTETENIETETTKETETTEEPDTQELVLVDMKGRQFELAGPARRVVALTAADCEILYELGAGDTLVGRGEYCDYPAEVLDIPAVQSGSETNIEQIIALEPDVIIMGTMDQTVEQIEAIEQAGITVVVTDAQDIAGIYDSIELIGAVTGLSQKAAEINSQLTEEFASVSAKAEENTSGEQNTIYFEVSPMEWGLWAAGNGTFMNELAEMIGLENTFQDVDQWGEISQEQVLERNPDYIVTITMYSGEGPKPEEEIMSRPGWAEISAVKNENVFHADSDELSRPGPRLVDGLNSLYAFVYGE